ncbi:MAG TPA: hypothetical protein VGF23_08175 [Gaiellaceae bacterium]
MIQLVARAVQGALPVLARRLHLLEARPPDVDPDTQRVFAAAVDDAIGGDGRIAWRGERPKHELLRWLVVDRPVLLHGSNRPDIEEFRPRAQTDFWGRPAHAVFATADGIWPLFFAVVRRRPGLSVWNTCMQDDGRSLYFFSVSGEVEWTEGAVYVLPRDRFERVAGSAEWASAEPVRPLAVLPVAPDDFPFRAAVLRHRAGESSLRFALRLLAARPPVRLLR